MKVEFAPRFNVEKALLAVFGGSGFQYTGESGGALIFQGSGGPAAQGRFGDWFGAGLEGKVVLVMTNPDYRTHVLSGRLYKSTTGPGGPWIPAPEGESGLKRLLKDVKDLARAM